MVTTVLCIVYLYWLSSADGCGVLTHMLISGRATEYYNVSDKYTNYRQLFDNHRDALQGGSAYPDSFYDSLCFGGKYHNVSEDTHWTPFINASVNYIRKTYPHPWNQETEKLVVFLFGVMSHQTADILWHSLGIDQGFLSTMAKVNFHGDFSTAHHFGDLGGEFISAVDLDADLVVDLNKWYIPTHDLFNIYQELYGATKISQTVIDVCSIFLAIESFGVMISKDEVYPGIVDRSPFLVEEMENYFLGGINDMVGWTQRSWNNVVTMLEKGTGSCNLEYNPVFVTCNKTTKMNPAKYDKVKNGHYVKYNKHGLTEKDFDVTRTPRGINIQPGKNLQKRLQKNRDLINLKEKPFMDKKTDAKNDIPSAKIMVGGSYARFGWSISSGDIDHDGNKDIIVGSPGYSHINNWQRGRVYIIYGSESKSGLYGSADINLDDQDLLNTTFIDGPDQMQSRFGSSVTVLDVNVDGVDDILVGSPAFWNKSPLDYNGLVSIYFGQKMVRKKFSKPDIIITCKIKYCNLGRTLASADVRNNGLLDLLIGAPFYNEQSGIVTSFPSSKNNKANQTYEFENLIQKWKLMPDKDQPYAWFGHNIKGLDTVVIVNSPNYRKCYHLNCSYSEYDIQCVGQSHLFSYWPQLSNFSIMGTFEYQSAGYDMDFGFPYDTKSWNSLMIAYSIPGNNVIGRLNGEEDKIYRAGSVILVNYTDNMSHVMARFDGNRKYARFGHAIRFPDLNYDGIADLVITEPSRIKDRSELQQNKNGRIYIFYGGNQMPKGNATFSPLCDQEQPCPSNIANYTSNSYEEQSNNGFLIHTVSTKKGAILLSSDVTSDAGFYTKGAGRRSGVVWSYYFKI